MIRNSLTQAKMTQKKNETREPSQLMEHHINWMGQQQHNNKQEHTTRNAWVMTQTNSNLDNSATSHVFASKHVVPHDVLHNEQRMKQQTKWNTRFWTHTGGSHTACCTRPDASSIGDTTGETKISYKTKDRNERTARNEFTSRTRHGAKHKQNNSLWWTKSSVQCIPQQQ